MRLYFLFYKQVAIKPLMVLLLLALIPKTILAQSFVKQDSLVSLQKHVPQVKDQGHYYNSVSWACVYYALSTQFNAENNLSTSIINKEEDKSFYYMPLNNYYSFSPFYGHNQIANSPHDGVVINEVLKQLKDEGVPLYKDFEDIKYKPSKKLKAFFKKYRRLLKIKKYKEIKKENFSNLAKTIKAKIDSGIPVVVAINIDQNFLKLTKKEYTPSPVKTGIPENHVVTIIGYKINKKNEVTGYKAVNSWGASWGDNGYFFINKTNLKTILNQAFYLKI